ncbi:T9SS type A sorting domain-containing protein [Mariniflexile sp.]|uniref:T9SS type A sorting domain-containing protein n=1 Tax=Mariniflexile sp. TaxID=1979402 RepID=UPI00356849E7
MKKTLLFTNRNSNKFYILLVFCLCFNLGWSQTNLVKNGALENHTIDVNDNADAFDMTPPSTVDVVNSVGVDSPYRYDATNNPNGWNNTALDTWLATSTTPNDSNEQPGSTSDGNKYGPKAGLGRGVKLYSPTRRLYQRVPVTIGVNYTFFIDSRSEFVFSTPAEQVTSEVFILNTEIENEVGLTSTSSTVDGYKLIDNDHNPSNSSSEMNTFTTNSFSFTATNNFVVIYIRAPKAVDGNHDVFYDNIELYTTASLSTKDVLASKLNIYPNPVKDNITIESSSVKISSVELYNVVGQKVKSQTTLIDNKLNVADLSKGMYLLKVSAEGSSTTKKILID